MATYGWREKHSVEEWLFEEGYRFDFFQAIKLLEKIHPDRVPIGEGSEANKEAVAISSSIDLEFPASDVAEVIDQKNSTVPTRRSLKCRLQRKEREPTITNRTNNSHPPLDPDQ